MSSSAAVIGAQAQRICTMTKRALPKLRPKMPITYAMVIEKLTRCANGSEVRAKAR